AAPLNPESYSAVRIGDRWFIRDNNAQDAESRGLRPVLIYENSRWWTGADLRCPANASWVKCAAEWDPYASLPETARPPKKKQAAAAGPSCDFEVRVPKWAPSPDSDEKRRIAGELLQELRQKQDRTTTLKAVYVRDFNLNDPVINVY